MSPLDANPRPSVNPDMNRASLAATQASEGVGSSWAQARTAHSIASWSLGRGTEMERTSQASTTIARHGGASSSSISGSNTGRQSASSNAQASPSRWATRCANHRRSPSVAGASHNNRAIRTSSWGREMGMTAPEPSPRGEPIPCSSSRTSRHRARSPTRTAARIALRCRAGATPNPRVSTGTIQPLATPPSIRLSRASVPGPGRPGATRPTAWQRSRSRTRPSGPASASSRTTAD